MIAKAKAKAPLTRTLLLSSSNKLAMPLTRTLALKVSRLRVGSGKWGVGVRDYRAELFVTKV